MQRDGFTENSALKIISDIEVEVEADVEVEDEVAEVAEVEAEVAEVAEVENGMDA